MFWHPVDLTIQTWNRRSGALRDDLTLQGSCNFDASMCRINVIHDLVGLRLVAWNILEFFPQLIGITWSNIEKVSARAWKHASQSIPHVELLCFLFLQRDVHHHGSWGSNSRSAALWFWWAGAGTTKHLGHLHLNNLCCVFSWILT